MKSPKPKAAPSKAASRIGFWLGVVPVSNA